MSLPLQDPALRSPRDNGIDSSRNHSGEDREFLSESHFLRLLANERRRSERSNRPFLLLLINGNGLFAVDGAGSVRDRAIAALLQSTREIDQIGWFSDYKVLGAIYAEFHESPERTIPLILRRVTEALRMQITESALQRVEVSVHQFPEEMPREHDHINDLTLYPDVKQRANQKKVVQSVKRAVDLLASSIALLLLLPVLIVIGAAIKLTSPGPVLFVQERLGQYGRPFRFMKFRSMHSNCDSEIHKAYIAKLIAGGKDSAHKVENGAAVYKITNDPRVTAVGRFLRKTSLDELPQFFNVLKGDMSLVGPRPPLPYEFEQYIPWHRRRILEAKPGITGLWQVDGRSRTNFDQMVRLDLRYAERCSLLLDLKILLKTPGAMISGDGAY